MVVSLLLAVLYTVAVASPDKAMPDDVWVKSDYNICDSLSKEDIHGDARVVGELSDVLLIFNTSDPEAADLGCVLRSALLDATINPIQMHEVPCMQLLTVDAEPDELHVIITRGSSEMEFCDAQVYGAIPSVIEVRITTLEKGKKFEYVTFNMITNGGHLRFDVDTGLSHAARNLLFAFRTLSSIAISGRPYENGFPKFHRASHLLTKYELGEAKDRFLKKLESTLPFSTNCMIAYIPLYIFASVVAFLLVVPCEHIQEAQLDTIVEEEEMRPERLPSLYADLTMNMIEKVMGLTVEEDADAAGTSFTADDAGLLELQRTI